MSRTFTVKIRRVLTQLEVDHAVRSLGVYRSGGWVDLRGTHLSIDLAAVEFADFSACARLVTVVEGAARHGAAVSITPPAGNLREGERRVVAGEMPGITRESLQGQRQRIALAVQARRRATSFLFNTGFFSAALLPHLEETELRPVLEQDASVWSLEIERWLSTAVAQELHAATPIGPPPYRMHDWPAILPLAWLSRDDDRGAWEKRFVDFLFGGDQLMVRSDADSVVTTVLRELVDNVFEHADVGEEAASEKPGALGSALVLDSAKKLHRADPADVYASDVEFNAWLGERSGPVVRILVADSGSGIPATLASSYARSHPSQSRLGQADAASRIILHAFEPSASRHDRKRRGVGLAVVRNFLPSYSGRVSVRAANAQAGYWHPESAAIAYSDSRLAYVPGTVIEVFLGDTTQGGVIRSYRLAADEREPANLVVVPTNVTRIQDKSMLAAVEAALARNVGPFPIVLLVVSGRPTSRTAKVNLALAVRGLAASIEGRGGLALVLTSASLADIASTFSPIDEIAGQLGSGPANWDVADWTPPVLVVAANGNPFWTGATTGIRELFEELLLASGPPDLSGWLATTRRSPSEIDYVRARRDWLTVDRTGKPSLRISLEDVDAVLESELESQLERTIGNDLGPSRT